MDPLTLAIGGSLVQGLFGGISAQKQANDQFVQAAHGNVAMNKAITDTNLQNTIRTGYKVGILNIQRGQAMQQATQQGFDLSKAGQQVLSSTSANAAASGNVGASIDAVNNDIKKKLDEADINIDSNLENTNFNLNTNLNDLVTAGQASLQYAREMDYTPPSNKVGSALLGSLLQSGVNFATQYATANMTLGLGK